MVAIGLVSYSLYLWHWPVLVSCRHYLNGGAPSADEICTLGALSAALAYLSYAFVEKPFRRPLHNRWRTVAPGLATLAVVAVPAYAIYRTDGVTSRVPPEMLNITDIDTKWKWDCRQEELPGLLGTYCVFGAPWNTASAHGLVWGDSHAQHTAPLVEPFAIKHNMAFVLLDSCPAALGGSVNRERPKPPGYVERCRRQRETAFRVAETQAVDVAILAASWNLLSRVVFSDSFAGTGTELVVKSLEEAMEALTRRGSSVIIVDQFPEFSGPNPANCALAERSNLTRKRCVGIEQNGYQASIIDTSSRFPGCDDVARTNPGAKVIHPCVAMCRDGTCQIWIHGEEIFRDTSHVRRNLSIKARAALADEMGLTDALLRMLPLASSRASAGLH